MSVTILDREMYTEAAAARLLRVAPSTLHWWLEGRPPRYRPVIRVEPTGSRDVTWAEFVEAGLLRSYRREHDVPLKELREFIDRLREEFQVLYPLADRRPYVGSGRRLLIDLQDRSHLDPEFCLVADVAARGWLIVTRDSMIIQNRNEIAAIRENNAKMAALNQRDAQTKWGQLEVFMTQWRHIEALTAERGPFIWRVSRTAMTSILWGSITGSGLDGLAG